MRFIDSKDATNSSSDFDRAIPIYEQDLFTGSLNRTMNANYLVTLEFNRTVIPLDNTVYYFVARAVDSASNVSTKTHTFVEAEFLYIF